MKEILKNSYKYPQSILYMWLYTITQYTWSILFILSIIIICYPSYQHIYYSWQLKEENKQLNTQKIEYQHRQQQLNIIRDHQINKHKQDNNFTNTYRNIERIIRQYQAKIINIQWLIEGEKIVSISIHQTSNIIFNIIQSLNNLENVKFTELNFTKLNENHLVQLDALLIIIEKNEDKE